MRKIFIFIVIIITISWFVYSWNFYTCKIKGFCNGVKKEEIIDNNKISSGSINKQIIKKNLKETIKQPETNTGVIKEEEKEEKKSKEECKDIITSPIKYGSDLNNGLEVKALEEFLNNTQGANLEVNGIYEKDDYEEVKKFQIKYREDILDPWGIILPTGYVYNTTMKKINEIYCLNIK